jgi:23S rRNA (adenine1618-N6)-methyltransferase
LHPRNKHSSHYEFEHLTGVFSNLKPFVITNQFGTETIDFANPKAVKVLNQALLKLYYQIDKWDIPKDYLCPPIPGRAEYIHHIADVLSIDNNEKVPTGSSIKILDIGIGANCIYPIIGHQEYGWHFVGSDIHQASLDSAKNIIEKHPVLHGSIECRLQSNPQHIFKNVIKKGDFFDFTICNPPFHASLEEATKGSLRKLHYVGKNKNPKHLLNFGGQENELWCEGGEINYILKMIQESQEFKTQCRWFSTLVSKQGHLEKINHALKKAKVSEIKTIQIEIGNKVSRVVCWKY